MSVGFTEFESTSRRLFRQYNGVLHSSPERDEYGFVRPSDELLRFEDFSGVRAALIVGPPWIGKSFVADQIERRAWASGRGMVLPTKLHLHSHGQSVRPAKWNEWIASANPALWTIDSLDEGEFIQRNIHQVILGELQVLGQEALLRLKLVMFCREAELPTDLIGALSEQFGEEFIAVELLPLTLDNARMVTAGGDFDEILRAIKKHGLQDASQYPAGLKYIQHHVTESMTTHGIWKGALRELLREQDADKQKHRASVPEIEDQFRAVSTLACAMTFAGIDTIGPSATDKIGWRLDELMPNTVRGNDPKIAVVRHAVGSAMFCHRSRFSQKNIREWLCAFALNELALGQLKTLLTNRDGTLNRNHLGVLALLMAFGRSDLREWLLETNRGLPLIPDISAMTLETGKHAIDRIEAISDSSSWELRLWEEDQFQQLAVDGVGAELATRIGDSSRSAKRRIVLLQMAIALKAREAVEPALAILRDARSPHSLAETALVFVKRVASTAELQSMDRYVRSAKPRTRIRRAIVSALIKAYLDQGYWSIEQAVVHAPDVVGEVLDSTYLLQKTLSERLTVDAARVVIQHRLDDALNRRTQGYRAERTSRESLLHQSIALFLAHDVPTESDLKMLIPIALREWENRDGLNFYFLPSFRKVEASRRELYLLEVEQSQKSGAPLSQRSYRWVLAGEDVDWLIENLLGPDTMDDSIWEDVIIAAQSGNKPTQEKATSFLREHRPNVLDGYLKAVEGHERLRREMEEEREAAKLAAKKEEIILTHFVRTVLDAKEKSLQERMWKLSMVCFPSEYGRPANVIGAWSDVDAATQNEVLDVCLKAIHECDPSRIADSGFSQAVQVEGWCFGAVVSHRSEKLGLDGQLIARWLPAHLIMTNDIDRDIVNACVEADKAATERVVCKMIERDLRDGSHAITATYLDAKHWSESLVESVVALITNSAFADEGRARLLKTLSERHSPRAIDIALECLKTGVETALGDAAIQVLLVFLPDEGWQYIEDDFAANSRRSLNILASLYDISTRYQFESWPSERLRRIASMLFHFFPPTRKRESRGGLVTPEYQCRQLRDAIPGMLLYRDGDRDREELDKLVAEYPFLKSWYEREIAEEKAKAVLSPDFLPINVIHEALSNPDYRWIRHHNDLLTVVQEQLHLIAKDIGEDSEMLFRIGDGEPRLQPEGAVQSYVFRRLMDRLPVRILGSDAAVIGPSRERPGHFLQRKDLLIEALCIDRSPASVVIEIKSSQNKEVSTSLSSQLGEKYLIAEGRTHGIYLVAWTGKAVGWKKHIGLPAPTTRDGLQNALECQAEEFCASHAGIVIRPIVFDCVWAGRDRAAKRRKSPNRTVMQKKRGNRGAGGRT